MLAPSFETLDIFGNPISLESYRGKKLLLGFYRNSACAMCNLRIRHLIQRYPDWKANGLEVLAVFESPLENMLRYVGKQDAPFPIIADPAGKLYSLYDVEVSEEKVQRTMSREDMQQMIDEAANAGFPLTKEEGSNFYRIPAEFLIGPDLQIVQAHYGEYIYDHLPFEQIEQFARKEATV
jgi:peroxiredoxin